MNPSDDMDAPVTRRELREELQQLEVRLEARLEAKLDSKLDAKFEKFRKEIDQSFLRHVNAVIENQRRDIGGLDDKYSSLPAKTAALEETVADLAPRVAVLERKVFAPRAKRPAKRAARRRR